MSTQPGSGAVPEDFETWFREAGGELLRWAYFYTRDPALAEDIAQESAIKVYKAWPDEETRETILTQPAYRKTIVKNCFLDRIKVRSRTTQDEAELDVEWHGRAETGNDQDLRLAILSLEDNEQEMIILRYYHDLTIREAGTQLGLSPSQAYRLHDKALAHLAGLLDEGEG
jgi:RNA polymerase sigma factor (sigma-70 family)